MAWWVPAFNFGATPNENESCDGKTFLGCLFSVGGRRIFSLELYCGILLTSIQLVAAQQASCHRCYGGWQV
eukprot:scaffold6259_cov75-Skeletonema_marinoi.AAC.9